MDDITKIYKALQLVQGPYNKGLYHPFTCKTHSTIPLVPIRSDSSIKLKCPQCEYIQDVPTWFTSWAMKNFFF